MAKVRLPAGKHVQSTVEWRYPTAHRYWDESGKLIAALESAFPTLKCQGLLQDGFRFEGLGGVLTSAAFYWDKASITRSGIGQRGVSGAAETFWALLADGLGVGEPTFVGHRTWLCFETEDPRAAAHWLDRLTLWQFGNEKSAQLGHPRNAGSILRTDLDEGGRRLRVELNAGTITIQSTEYKGVIADADVVVERPAAIPTDFADYLDWNTQFLIDRLEPAIRDKRD
jgi:hypothetical protein